MAHGVVNCKQSFLVLVIIQLTNITLVASTEISVFASFVLQTVWRMFFINLLPCLTLTYQLWQPCVIVIQQVLSSVIISLKHNAVMLMIVLCSLLVVKNKQEPFCELPTFPCQEIFVCIFTVFCLAFQSGFIVITSSRSHQ